MTLGAALGLCLSGYCLGLEALLDLLSFFKVYIRL